MPATLHAHLERHHIEYLQFAFRWMNNLLMREMPLHCVIRLWDTYLVQFLLILMTSCIQCMVICAYSEWVEAMISQIILIMAALRSRCGHYIFALWFLLSSVICFSRLFSSVADLMFTILPHVVCGLSTNLGCRSETCCTRLAENTGCKKSPSVDHRTTLSGCIFATHGVALVRI